MSRQKLISLGKNIFQTYRKPAAIVGGACSCFFIGRNLMSTRDKKGPMSPNGETKRVTRKDMADTLQETREYYINMPMEEKRKLYKCGNKYVLPSTVEQWDIYGETIVDRYAFTPKDDVNEDLNQIVCLWRGDITKLEIDGIVNAANRTLMGGGGVDGAIHSSAGFKLREETGSLGGCNTGEAKITAGYNLPAKYIIHTVGPIGVNADMLRSCYSHSLDLAVANGIKTVAFPCISTGIYGYDIEKATPVVLQTVRDWLSDVDNRNKVEKIIFCVFLERDVQVYEKNLLEYFPLKEGKPSSGDEKGSSKKVKSGINGKQTKDKSESKTPTKESKKKADKINGKEAKETDVDKVSANTPKETNKEEETNKGNEENIRAVAELVNVDKKTEENSNETDNQSNQVLQSKTGTNSEKSEKSDNNDENKIDVKEEGKDGQTDKKTKKVKSPVDDVLAPAAKKKSTNISPVGLTRPPNAVL